MIRFRRVGDSVRVSCSSKPGVDEYAIMFIYFLAYITLPLKPEEVRKRMLPLQRRSFLMAFIASSVLFQI